MMFRKSCLLYLFILSIAYACNTGSRQADAPAAKSDTAKWLTGLDFQPQMKQADSLQVLYYNNPDGDTEAYTRFYSYVPTTDSGFVHTLFRSLDKPFQELQQVKDCRSEGKIYLFKRGEENPLQTVYFSTRCDSCCYLYYIKTGRFYYLPLSQEAKHALQELKSR